MSDHENGGLNLPIIPSCDGCGGCCCRDVCVPPLYARILRHGDQWNRDDPDYVRVTSLSDRMKQEILERAKLVDELGRTVENQICIWLDQVTGQCTHYDLRPSRCRDFERGSAECHDLRKRY